MPGQGPAKKGEAPERRSSANASKDADESVGSEEEEQNNLQRKSERLREKAVGKFGNQAADEGEWTDEEEAADLVRDALWADLMGDSQSLEALPKEAVFLRRLRRRGTNIDAISTLYRRYIDIMSIFVCISNQYRLNIDMISIMCRYSVDILSIFQVGLPAPCRGIPQRRRQRRDGVHVRVVAR